MSKELKAYLQEEVKILQHRSINTGDKHFAMLAAELQVFIDSVLEVRGTVS